MYPICHGIDLGTSNSCIARFFKGPEAVKSFGNSGFITPSYVKITDESCIVGDVAKSFQSEDPEHVFYASKRLIGRIMDKNLKKEIENLTFNVDTKGKYPSMPLKIRGKEYNLYPEHISSLIIKKLFNDAQISSSRLTQDVVIAVPANFNNFQRHSTMDAGKIAGLNVLKVISEPVAASLYYIYKTKPTKANMNILVYDFGGGTLDVSLVEMKGNQFNVLATAGNPHIGGIDIDKRIVRNIISLEFLKDGIDIYAKDKKAYINDLARIQLQAEEAKKALSKEKAWEFMCSSHGVDKMITITRSMIESICAAVFKDILKPIDEVLEASKIFTPGSDKGEYVKIDDVILTGGSTKIPFVQKIIEEKLNMKIQRDVIDSESAVALGAALYGAIFLGNDIEGLPSIIEINDVIPMDIKIETPGSALEPLIRRNCKLQNAHTNFGKYQTHKDNQENITLSLYEGNEKYIASCYKVAEFVYKVPKAPAGKEYIFARFDFSDENITIYGSESFIPDGDPLPPPLSIEEYKGAHSSEEIIRMKQDVGELRKDEAKVTPSEYLVNWIRRIRGKLNRNIQREKKSTVSKKMIEYSNWGKNNTEASEDEVNEKINEIMNFIKGVSIEAYNVIFEKTIKKSSSSKGDKKTTGLILIE